MSNSPALVSYRDVLEMWQRALESPNGVKTTCPSPQEAIHVRFRLYNARKQLRAESKRIHPPDSPQWGRSPYDDLVVKVVGTQVLVVKAESLLLDIEEL